MNPTSHLDLVRRTRVPTLIAATSAAHWMFGNLYEEVVLIPPALVEPRPGALVGPLDVGSPVYYYGPTLPVAVAASWWVVARTGPDARARRLTRRAATAVTIAAALKAALITSVNPRFRDPAVDAADVRAWTVVWLVGNGATVVALATGLIGLLAWRRTDP